MPWHGDCDANDDFNFDDINPFVYFVLNEICDPDGWQGGEELRDEGNALAPAEMAAVLAANVDPGLYAGLRDIVANAAAAYGETDLGEYWISVYECLAE